MNEAMLDTLKRAESIVRATHGADDVADDLYALGCELGRDTTYNGWTNYPTWAVNLWLSNDQSTYSEVLELVKQPVDLLGSESGLVYIDEDRRQGYAAAERIQNLVHDYVDYGGGSLATDLLGYSLGLVDWREIATSWLEQYADEIGATA